MTWLKQSTAVTVPIGPIVDSTDGATAETALTISQADIRLSKNGGAFAQSNNAAGASHMENGWYGVPLDTTDTNTLGTLVVNINESGGLQVWARFMVVPANVWDSMFGADKLQVHVDEMTAGIITASVIATGAVDADAIAADAVTEIQSGLALAADLATAAGYIDTEVAAIKAKTDNLPSDPADASDIASAFSTVNTNLSTIAGYLDTEIAAIKAKTDNLPAAPAATGDIPSAAGIATAVLTTQMTESYSTDGAAPTLAQAAFLTIQRLYDFAISGTTISVKGIDGTTEVATITLDDATTPTSSSRAT